jgi:hypothetical protein
VRLESEELRNDKQLLVDALRNRGDLIHEVPKHLQVDVDIISAAKQGFLAQLHKNKRLRIENCSCCGGIIIPTSFYGDKGFILSAAGYGQWLAVKTAFRLHPELESDRPFMHSIVPLIYDWEKAEETVFNLHALTRKALDAIARSDKTWDAGFDTRGWAQRKGQRARLMRRRRPGAPNECRGRTSWSRSHTGNKHGRYDRLVNKKKAHGHQVRTGGWGFIKDDCLTIMKQWSSQRAHVTDIFPL